MVTVSVTERNTFKRCRRQWDYSSKGRMNLTRVGSGPEPLELGGLIHRALADWMQSSDISLPALFLQHSAQRQVEIIEAFKERTGRSECPPELLESLHNVVQLGVAMMTNYAEYHKTPLPSNMRFASPEQEVVIPVSGTEHACEKCLNFNSMNRILHTTESLGAFGKYLYHMERVVPAYSDCDDCSGKGYVCHNLSATLDGLAQDEKDWLYVIEHKTYENRPRPMDLYMNDQFTGYCWVVRELGIGRVAGVAYDGMWKRDKPPKYMQREKRAGKMDDLFIRKILHKEDAELDEWGSHLADEINEMANNPAIYPHVPWSGCGDCSFQQPCYMKMRGEDNSNIIKVEYTQREIIRGGQAIQ